MINSLFEDTLKETCLRFNERKNARVNNLDLFKEGKIAEVNPPELIKSRMARVYNAPGESFQTFQRGFERVMGNNDLMSVRFFEGGLNSARSVVRIQIRSAQGTPIGYGTGFMVSPRLLLTNHHVFPTRNATVGSIAEFDYQLGLDGKPKMSRFFNFAPDDFFITDKTLDYTLVALQPDSNLASYGWLPLIAELGKVIVGEWVNIIQHPNGELKQLAVRENQVVDELDLHLHYLTDTAPGSSGSPVFNDQWEVVALHHSGVPKRNAQGRIMAVDDRPWEDWMGEHRIAWEGNEGIRISKLVAHINNQILDSSQKKKLRAEMFEALPTNISAEGFGSREDATKSKPKNSDPSITGPTVDTKGIATWSIPLQISVGIGNGITPDSGVSVTKLGTSPTIPSQTIPTQVTTGDNSELQEALEDFSTARTRVYYDQASDQDNANAYYARIDTTISERELFESLSQLIRSTHSTIFSYKPAVHLYPWIDLHPDLRIRSIYSGQDFDPETLIREDFRITSERAAHLREIILNETIVSTEKLEEKLDLLEASLPYNCEHVVPQSWFNKREPMRGDLHHLFACESGCNSFRGNTPYYDFPDFEEVSRDQCGKRFEDKFEPGSGKGAVSRAVLYFLLRYPLHIGDATREMQSDRLQALLKWHKQYPPDLYEKHRNSTIFEKQGNRNPLIDRPDWAEKIDFSHGIG